MTTTEITCPWCGSRFAPLRRHLSVCDACRAPREAREADRAARKRQTVVLVCQRCGSEYDKPRRGKSYYCEPCRHEVKREQDRDGKAARAAELAELGDRVKCAIPEYLYPTLDEYLGDLDFNEDEDWALTTDKMPAGANSPSGPDEGRSTYFADLVGELDDLCKRAARDEWWTENRFWERDLHDSPDAARRWLEEMSRQRQARQPVACGAKVGTRAGYEAHRRRGESACQACKEAERARKRPAA